MVVLRRKRYYVVYPEYFEKSISRKNGRRVPLNLATKDSSLAKLKYACEKLELDYEIEKDKAFPSNWWNRSGRVLIKIDKAQKTPKETIIKEIGGITKKLKSKKKSEIKSSKKDTKSKYTTKSTHSKKKTGYQSKKKRKDTKKQKEIDKSKSEE